MKKFLFSGAFALAVLTAIPASANCLNGCTVKTDFDTTSFALSGGINGVIGGTIKKRLHESGTGTINEADLTVTIDKDGIKKVDGTFHTGGYAYNQNSVLSNDVGTSASGSFSGSTTFGSSVAKIKFKK